MNPLTIILVIVVLLVVYAIVIYNGLVTLKNRVDNGWAQIDTQLQRRYDLIPNLIETVKGYAKHESEVFEKVTAARAGMANATTVGEKAEADNALSGTLKTLFAVAEAYPDLRANENFKELQVELTNTENKISFARQFYNDTVARLNIAIQKFPRNIIAGMFNFKECEYFKTDSQEVRTAPKVSF
ncbi:MAG: LemA family protein [Defluviitaleaceae bacterium]|nr:LemA family protein [Defluviitaleaceae bacterium]